MAIIADIFLMAGALAACFYCFILSRRLKRLTNLEHGVGGAIAVLSVQVDDLSKALKQAETVSKQSSHRLATHTQTAEGVAKRLELLIASLHDLPEPPKPKGTMDPLFSRTSMANKEFS